MHPQQPMYLVCQPAWPYGMTAAFGHGAAIRMGSWALAWSWGQVGTAVLAKAARRWACLGSFPAWTPLREAALDRRRPLCMLCVSVPPRNGLGGLISSGDHSFLLHLLLLTPCVVEARNYGDLSTNLQTQGWQYRASSKDTTVACTSSRYGW